MQIAGGSSLLSWHTQGHLYELRAIRLRVRCIWLWQTCYSLGVPCAMVCMALSISSFQSGSLTGVMPPLDVAARVGVEGTGGGDRRTISTILRSASWALWISASADMRSLGTCSWACCTNRFLHACCRLCLELLRMRLGLFLCSLTHWSFYPIKKRTRTTADNQLFQTQAHFASETALRNGQH